MYGIKLGNAILKVKSTLFSEQFTSKCSYTTNHKLIILISHIKLYNKVLTNPGKKCMDYRPVTWLIHVKITNN